MADVEALLRALLEPLRRVGPTVHVTYAEAFQAALGVDPSWRRTGEIEARCVAPRSTCPRRCATTGTACSTWGWQPG